MLSEVYLLLFILGALVLGYTVGNAAKERCLHYTVALALIFYILGFVYIIVFEPLGRALPGEQWEIFSGLIFVSLALLAGGYLASKKEGV